ncbi:MAG: hypothetical protein QM820_08780 [Minicystis sp.]
MSPSWEPDFPDHRRDVTWPRLYRASRRQTLFVGGMGALMLAGGLAALIAVIVSKPQAWGVFVIGGLFFAALGAVCVVGNRRDHVLLFADAIEIVELGSGRRRMRRDEIVGMRIIPGQYGFHQFVFELQGDGRKPLKTYLYVERDAIFDAWLASIPNLDARDRERAEADLLQRPDLGDTEEERRQALARSRWIARTATGFGMAATAWGFFYPKPYTAAIVTLAVIPLLALALLLRGRGRYAVDGDRNEVRPTLFFPLYFPGVALGMRAILDFQCIGGAKLVLWAAPLAVAYVALLVSGDPDLRRRWFIPIIMVPFLGFYPWGALAMANALLDRGAPQRFEVAVTDKYVTSGKSPTYNLKLAPWGPARGGNVIVHRDLYRAVEIGDTVCVRLRAGALDVPWFRVDRRCDEMSR